MKSILLFCIIFITSYMCIADIKYKQIDSKELIIYGIISMLCFINKLICNFCFDTVLSLLMSLLVGFAILMLSIISRESLGLADAIFFIINAGIFDWTENLMIFIIGIFLSAIFAMFIILIKISNIRKNVNLTFPFIPFVMIPYLYFLYNKF